MTLPSTDTLLLRLEEGVLHITLNRPEVKNAMSLTMVNELMATFSAIKDDLSVRAVVIRGANQQFCAGGDIKDMAGARATAQQKAASDEDPFFALNRAFGRMITQVNEAPQVVIAVLEGAVLGGGFGLACVSDVALALESARFGLPETGLGLPPAQIAPFVVQRIGLTQARRLALLGARFDGHEAERLGIVHRTCNDADGLEDELDSILNHIQRCAPQANRTTKALLLSVGQVPMDRLLDQAARHFSEAIQSDEGQEGTMAFVQKRLPRWAEK